MIVKGQMEDAAPKIVWGFRLFEKILLLIPLWLPLVYMGAAYLEMQITKHGPLGKAALFFLFIAPLMGALPLIRSNNIPYVAKVLLVPGYYFVGLGITFFLGWFISVNLFGP